ncbi:MAG: efflux RND transporter permease subunit, partial [Planctomycetes bacterium]|nr:efflux RND transporter permease subunit [Planctomycetota bacterium]
MSVFAVSFAVYTLAIVAIGIYSARFARRSGEDYFLAGRSLGSWMAALSASASSESGWVTLGLVGTAFTRGVQAYWIIPGCLLGFMFNWFVLAGRLRERSDKLGALTLPDGTFRIDGLPAISFAVLKEHGTNTVVVADRVKDRLAAIEGLHPAGTRMFLDYDESKEIRTQLTDLRERAIVAALVIFAVLLLFLQSFRSAGIIFATIVFSVLITLNLIYFGGLTLNVLTLMGLAMGFGLIVDNAIVVLENVYRKHRAGASPQEAALSGSREVLLPIVAATLTTLIVFVPFVYLQGELRIYYIPLAIVVGMSLLASLLVAFSF